MVSIVGITIRKTSTLRSDQRSGMLVDKTAHSMFMVPLVKFGSSLVSGLWAVRKFGTYCRAHVMPVCGLFGDTPLSNVHSSLKLRSKAYAVRPMSSWGWQYQ